MTTTATTMLTLVDIQAFYERAYIEARDNKKPNEVHLGMNYGGQEKTFVERNFYWCGFNYIVYVCNTKANRQLHKAVRGRKNYDGGFTVPINKIGQMGNGDFEIQQEAFSRTASFLEDNGYQVYAESRMD